MFSKDSQTQLERDRSSSRKSPKMSAPLRSKQGCWTCRLRRKKCDERRDVCLTCESLSITCYGYGAKPDWMDGGEKERNIAIGIKQIVKHTSRKKGRLGTTLARFRKSPGVQENKEDVVLAPKTDNPAPENRTGGAYLEPAGSSTSPVCQLRKLSSLTKLDRLRWTPRQNHLCRIGTHHLHPLLIQNTTRQCPPTWSSSLEMRLCCLCIFLIMFSLYNTLCSKSASQCPCPIKLICPKAALNGIANFLIFVASRTLPTVVEAGFFPCCYGRSHFTMPA